MTETTVAAQEATQPAPEAPKARRTTSRARAAREAAEAKSSQESQQPPASSTTPEPSKAAEKAISTGAGAVADAAPKEPRYVTDEAVITELAEGIEAARARGFGRSRLSDELGMPGRNAIWRANVVRKVQPDEVDPIRKLLARIEAGEVKPPERKAAGAGGSKPPRATRGELEAKLDAVAQILHANWREIRPASVRDELADIVGAPREESSR